MTQSVSKNLKYDLKCGESGVRLDVFISEKTGLSRALVKKTLEESGCTVNGMQKFKPSYELKEGDYVQFLAPEPKELDIKPSDIPLDIIYQDDDFAVINKPQGMVVHPATSYDKDDTLVNALLFSLDKLSGINGVIRPGIVHRIDKNTSGLLVVAKNDEAHKNLAKQIESKQAKRIYFGLVDGNVKEDEGVIDEPIGRSKKDRKKMAVTEDGKSAKTFFKVLERFKDYTLMRFELSTGRTHQIRVHSKFIHHPITGDDVYGGSTKLWKGGQLLHAKELYLTHPRTGEQMKFECDLPDYFEAILDKLRKK